MCFDGPIFVFSLMKPHVFWWTQKPHVFWWTLPLLKPHVFWWTQKNHVSLFFPLLKPNVFWWTQKPYVFWWTLDLMSFEGPDGSIKRHECQTFRWYGEYLLEWVLCFRMVFHACINLFWQRNFKNDSLYHLDLPLLTCLQIDKNGSKTLMKPWFDIPQGTFFLDLRLDFKCENNRF